MKYLFVALTICVSASNGWAINKCTGADGKVLYQEGACSTGQASVTVDIAPDPKAAEKRWSFTRQKDSMTGDVTCFAASPVEWIPSRPTSGRSFAKVYLQLSTPAGTGARAPLITVRSWESSEGMFHTDIAGTGMRIDEQPFMPFSVKHGSHVLAFPPNSGAIMVDQLQGSKSFRLRLRFWPYENLVDSPPITLAGYSQALVALQKCSTN
jgi:hypothetical protein